MQMNACQRFLCIVFVEFSELQVWHTMHAPFYIGANEASPLSSLCNTLPALTRVSAPGGSNWTSSKTAFPKEFWYKTCTISVYTWISKRKFKQIYPLKMATNILIFISRKRSCDQNLKNHFPKLYFLIILFKKTAKTNCVWSHCAIMLLFANYLKTEQPISFFFFTKKMRIWYSGNYENRGWFFFFFFFFFFARVRVLTGDAKVKSWV